MILEMVDLLTDNLIFLFLALVAALLFIWLGWKIRLWWRNFLFMLLRRRGKKGEKASIKFLEKSGYKILKEQISLDGYLLVDDALRKFELRPDLLVEKDGIRYIAEIKTGEVANPGNRNTRRQLHEYSYYSGYDIILLVDPIKKSIKRISFKR
jgi:hypothetical protein